MSTNDILQLNTIQEYNDFLGAETLHPQVNVLDLSTLETIRHCRKNFGFYCIILKELVCGTLQYGRNQYDYQAGTLVAIGPGQISGVNDGGETRTPKGYVLMFHPDLLYGTPLAQSIRSYTFFSYDANEALHMSDREHQIIINCLLVIREELEYAIDKHSKKIIASNIEVLLNHCTRFYDRQFVTREVKNHDLLSRFEQMLLNYFSSEKPQNIGLPSVQYCAEQLHLSPNYFGDLIKRETGKSAQDYIQTAIVERVKERLLQTDKTVTEIAYELGFNYPQHMTRLFKKIVGQVPNEYRAF